MKFLGASASRVILSTLVAVSAFACQGSGSGPKQNADGDRQISFVPREARIGDTVTITGSGWNTGLVTLYLIPSSKRDELAKLFRNGELAIVGTVSVGDDGRLFAAIDIPAQTTTQNGKHDQLTEPGNYSLGAGTLNGIHAVGVLVIEQ